MGYANTIKPISYFKAHASEVIKEIHENHQTMVITQSGEPKVVIQDVAEYDRIQNSLAMLKIVAQGRDDYENGRVMSSKQVKEEIFKYLDNKR